MSRGTETLRAYTVCSGAVCGVGYVFHARCARSNMLPQASLLGILFEVQFLRKTDTGTLHRVVRKPPISVTRINFIY